MFRKSSLSQQLDIFTSVHTHLTGKSLSVYGDKSKWHNQFRVQVTHRIDESLFQPLYHDGFGAPNASIRVLISMMVLKEAQGWSDAQLFEQCSFNILVRSALDFHNLTDPIPAPSTYYLLRKRIVDWEKSGNENLMEKVFAQITNSQCVEFNISGNKIRMDSKLLGSNIAWYSRYELIHETLRTAYANLKTEIDCVLSPDCIAHLESISKESGDKVSYRSSKSEIESKLTALGVIIHEIISKIDASKHPFLETLRRVFSEQYRMEQEHISVRDKQEISACSVQSPHDPDCHYRKKDEQQVQGYSVNITETCDADVPLNLITNVSVDVATAADCNFLQPSIEASREVVVGKIATVNADGAYHSSSNQDYCVENDIDLVIGAIQGKPSRYDLKLDQDNQLTVTDLTTNTPVIAREVECRKEGAERKWAYRMENGKLRYFTQKEIDVCLLRKQIAARPQSELNVRNNVEASIFQLGYHCSNAKSKYRGLIKQKIWANARCLWVNFKRILNFVATLIGNKIAGGVSKYDLNVQNCHVLFCLSEYMLNKCFRYLLSDVVYTNSKNVKS
jgi:hypothetical protein